MQNVSKEKLDTGPSLANKQLNNTKVSLSSEYSASHAHVTLLKNESNLPLWMWVDWKAFTGLSHIKYTCFLTSRHGVVRLNMFTREPKRQRTELILSKGNPNLECINSGKSILKCLSWLRSLLTSYNIRHLLVTKLNFAFLSFLANSLSFILNY